MFICECTTKEPTTEPTTTEPYHTTSGLAFKTASYNWDTTTYFISNRNNDKTNPETKNQEYF